MYIGVYCVIWNVVENEKVGEIMLKYLIIFFGECYEYNLEDWMKQTLKDKLEFLVNNDSFLIYLLIVF